MPTASKHLYSPLLINIGPTGNIDDSNYAQGQAARKAHKAQDCWPPCKKILNFKKQTNKQMCTGAQFRNMVYAVIWSKSKPDV